MLATLDFVEAGVLVVVVVWKSLGDNCYEFPLLLCSPEADVEHLWQRTQAWQVNH